MSGKVIQVEGLWKEYRLGIINHHTLASDFQSWWARLRGKEDPNSPVSIADKAGGLVDKDRFWALRDVSFEVNQGDILGIIGRNGAGKSTLLKILSQVTAPTKGEVRYKGRIASLLEVGTGFHPELTGRENVFLNGAILGMSKADIRSRLDEIIAFSEVDKFIDTPVKRYSSGMYVRLAFAVAAHLEPEILIVDEVLAVGDAAFQKKCLGKMEKVGREGRTVLFVSHNMITVQSLCNKALLLDNGKVADYDDVHLIVSSYVETVCLPLLSWIADDKGRGTESKICEVSVVDQAGIKKRQINTDEDLIIKIVVEIRNNEHQKLSLDLTDSFNAVIFATSPANSGISLPKNDGIYVFTVYFPPRLLLPKTYGIKVTIWEPGKGEIDTVTSILFTVQESLDYRRKYSSGCAGLISLSCRWFLSTSPKIRGSDRRHELCHDATENLNGF